MTKPKHPDELRKHPLHALDDLMALLYPVMTDRELGELLGCSAGTVRNRALKLGLAKAPGWHAEISTRRTLERSPFTPAVRSVIEARYATTPTVELAAELGLSIARIHAYATKNGWHKNVELVRLMAKARAARPDHPMRKFQYPKGHVPANKGMTGFCHPASVPTQFKKGNRPYSWKPIGSYRVESDGYLQRKVTDTGYPPKDWRFVHRLVWEAAHGPIPDKHIVRFKKGRKTTVLEAITLDAIECISMAENLRLNHPRLVDPELGKLVQLRAVMTRQIRKFSKLNDKTTNQTGDTP
jgi:hypothetical protein